MAVVSLLSLHNLAAQERTAVQRVQTTPAVEADAQRGDAPVHVATAGVLW
ncbi:hypothetical protein [Xanthomonas arboricola]|nr:hypothetical protein [Xanthomonas arboricola]